MTTMYTRGPLAGLAGAAIWLVAAAAPAFAQEQPSAAFGRPGTVVLAVSAASGAHRAATAPDASGPAVEAPGLTAFAVSAAAHVFVAPRWSVGVSGAESWSRVDSAGTRTTLEQTQLELRVGRLLPAGPWASVWPQLGFGFARTAAAVAATAPAAHATAAIAGLDVPLLLQPSRAFFVALGPTLEVRVGQGSEALNVGGRITFGAALGLAGG